MEALIKLVDADFAKLIIAYGVLFWFVTGIKGYFEAFAVHQKVSADRDELAFKQVQTVATQAARAELLNTILEGKGTDHEALVARTRGRVTAMLKPGFREAMDHRWIRDGKEEAALTRRVDEMIDSCVRAELYAAWSAGKLPAAQPKPAAAAMAANG